jgi:broad specificity phosphatase PhoE
MSGRPMTDIAREAVGEAGSFGRLSEAGAGEMMESVCARCERLKLEHDARRQRSERGGPPPARNVRGFERIQMGCNPPTYDEAFTVRILFVRHGESCANLWKSAKFLGQLRKTQYKDPELTRRGQELAAQRGKEIKEWYQPTPTTSTAPAPAATGAVGRPGAKATGTTPIICSSQLFRAIQTADAIPIPGKIWVLPFIQESGAGQDNEAFAPAERRRYPELAAKLDCLKHGAPDYSFFDRAARSAEPNVPAFLRWVQCNVKNLVVSASATLRETVDLVVVTHSNFLKSLQSYFTRLPGRARMPVHKFNNLDMMEVQLRVRYEGTALIHVGEIKRFVPMHDNPAAPDNCRFPVYGKGTPYCARDVVRFDDAVATAGDTGVGNMNYYTGPREPTSGLNTGASLPRILGSAVTPTATSQIEFFLPRSPMLGATDADFVRQINIQYSLAQDNPTLDMIKEELIRALDAHREQVSTATLEEARAVGRIDEAEAKRQEWLGRYDARRAAIQAAYDTKRRELNPIAAGGRRRRTTRRQCPGAGRGPVRMRSTARRRRAASRRRTTQRRHR